MEKQKVIGTNGKVIADIFYFLDNISEYKSKEDFITQILKDMPSKGLAKYAGCSKYELKKTLLWCISDISLPSIDINKEIISQKLKEVLDVYLLLFNLKKISLFIFPTFDDFIINKMNGVSGFCTRKNIILIFLNPVPNFETVLKRTMAHELAHALSPFYWKHTSLGDWLILDGIAENFQVNFIEERDAQLANLFNGVISEKEILKIFNEIKNRLNSKNNKFHKEVFYGTGKYPLWSGYAIGYYIVKEYLKKQKKVNWSKIIKTKPRVILNEFLRTYI